MLNGERIVERHRACTAQRSRMARRERQTICRKGDARRVVFRRVTEHANARTSGRGNTERAVATAARAAGVGAVCAA